MLGRSRRGRRRQPSNPALPTPKSNSATACPIAAGSALSVTGKVFAAYFDMINEKGGVNGRKLNMLSLDDGFSPPKTVEATRRLVENDGVASCSALMARADSATAKISQPAPKVPHLFLISSGLEMERARHQSG